MLLSSLFALSGSLGSGGLSGLLCLALGGSGLELLLLGNALGLLLGGSLVSSGLLSLASGLLGTGGLLLLGLGLHVSSAHLIGDDGVDERHHAGLTVGGLVLVDNALGDGLVEQTASVQALVLSSGCVAGGNGLACSADGGLRLGLDGAVELTGLLVGDVALLLTLDVCHCETPSL